MNLWQAGAIFLGVLGAFAWWLDRQPLPPEPTEEESHIHPEPVIDWDLDEFRGEY